MGIRFVLDPPSTPELREKIVRLWTEVTNAGGAVGFVDPVTEDEVRPTALAALREAADGPDHLLVGYRGDELVALLFLTDNRFHLKAHWCVLKRVMVRPTRQGNGYGQALLREAEQVARKAGREALHLTVRDGQGVQDFYRRLGYREVGRLPGALRVGPADDRDEIQMWLPLT
ncbi:GNAT family N-acetyltransferase [Micromonospora sp. WMMD1102]|uniref:GNAT family N-acetyltransferase n=1 Tax=Micromonospora sp. WMMD1102 TaxID=3016105 RepID=UPI00241582C7|nr:GNAT family N-acetyltransferase [Micromonospora sp. WMMD1102]MDG4785271.1 GNAT family N-acetyltransferase [Micromonospora sp. WMMD1102]